MVVLASIAGGNRLLRALCELAKRCSDAPHGEVELYVVERAGAAEASSEHSRLPRAAPELTGG
jgi:hypothetical protein